MILGWLKVVEKISHLEAFHRPELVSKRMGNKNPNGNIIVDAQGEYNRFDGGVHKSKFDLIKFDYVIGSNADSRMLSDQEIRRLAPEFLTTLGSIIGVNGSTAFDIIARKGRRLDEIQVERLLEWLKTA
jgi:hypothetical protein